jgi:hypothetical protein
MQKLISAKWIILITVLINVATTFAVVTILPSGMWVANASSKANCVTTKSVFHGFKNDGGDSTYTGKLFGNSLGNHKIATMTITFTGTAPKSDTDRGNLTKVVFSAKALSNPFNFKDIQTNGDGLDKSQITALSDFTLNLADGGKIHFINGSFTGSGSQIVGLFDVIGGDSNGANGSWIVG